MISGAGGRADQNHNLTAAIVAPVSTLTTITT